MLIIAGKSEVKGESAVNDINIELKFIKTNYRVISRSNWEYSFSCALVSALSNLRHMAGTCIVPSSEPYDSLVIPWGSSPVTDHLLSSDGLIVMHDGASHSRLEKIKEIYDWKVGVENLRVCWEGDLKDRNCGKCEKCLRTKLNFLVTGNPIPNCFTDSKNIYSELRRVQLRNEATRSEWKQIYEYARKNNVEGDWINYLPRLIKKKYITDVFLPKGSYQRKVAKKFINMLSRH